MQNRVYEGCRSQRVAVSGGGIRGPRDTNRIGTGKAPTPWRRVSGGGARGLARCQEENTKVY